MSLQSDIQKLGDLEVQPIKGESFLDLLSDLGFQKGESLYADTWVYDGMFWVEVVEPEIWVWYTFEGDERGERHSIHNRASFLKAFIEAVTRRAIDSAQSYQPD